jgi:methionyl-tRNA formyltransferase
MELISVAKNKIGKPIMKIIFAGSSKFGIPTIIKLKEKHQLLLIISQPDKPAGRKQRIKPCPIARFAKDQKLELYQPKSINSSESIAKIKQLNPELLITASYGEIIKKEVRQIPLLGAINIHPSLLPKYRGPTPIQTALLNGENKTGTTIFKLTSRLDAGPILAQRELVIQSEDNFGSLEEKLANISAELLGEILPAIKDKTLTVRPQNENLASYTHKFDKQDLWINWKDKIRNIFNQIRAFSPHPGARTFIHNTNLKILQAEMYDFSINNKTGTIAGFIKNKGIIVNCQDGKLLITKVQAEGKKVMSAWAYQLGARLSEGESFEPFNKVFFQNS